MSFRPAVTARYSIRRLYKTAHIVSEVGQAAKTQQALEHAQLTETRSGRRQPILNAPSAAPDRVGYCGARSSPTSGFQPHKRAFQPHERVPAPQARVPALRARSRACCLMSFRPAVTARYSIRRLYKTAHIVSEVGQAAKTQQALKHTQLTTMRSPQRQGAARPYLSRAGPSRMWPRAFQPHERVQAPQAGVSAPRARSSPASARPSPAARAFQPYERVPAPQARVPALRARSNTLS